MQTADDLRYELERAAVTAETMTSQSSVWSYHLRVSDLGITCHAERQGEMPKFHLVLWEAMRPGAVIDALVAMQSECLR